jgi:hypothetical protein
MLPFFSPAHIFNEIDHVKNERNTIKTRQKLSVVRGLLFMPSLPLKGGGRQGRKTSNERRAFARGKEKRGKEITKKRKGNESEPETYPDNTTAVWRNGVKNRFSDRRRPTTHPRPEAHLHATT